MTMIKHYTDYTLWRIDWYVRTDCLNRGTDYIMMPTSYNLYQVKEQWESVNKRKCVHDISVCDKKPAEYDIAEYTTATTSRKELAINAAKHLMDWARLNPHKASALCDAMYTIKYLLTNNDTVVKNDLSAEELQALMDIVNLTTGRT